MKKLYELEYKIGNLRKQYLSQVKNDDLTLKQILDLGFNKIQLYGFTLYKDNEDEYLIDNYYLRDENILNKKIIYIDSDVNYIYEDDLYDYLEIKIDFVNKDDRNLLYEYTKEIMQNEK